MGFALKCLVIYLSLMFSVSLLASNPPPDHYSKSLTDLVLRVESDQEDLEDPTYPEKFVDLIRLYQSTTYLHIALVRGEKGVFEDRLSKLNLKSFSKSATEGLYLARAVSSVLSLATELGWNIDNQSSDTISSVWANEPTQDITHTYEKLSHHFRRGDAERLSEVLSALPPLSTESNHWERFVNGIGNFYLYRLKLSEPHLRRSRVLIDEIYRDDALNSVTRVKNQELFKARVSFLLVNITLAGLTQIDDPALKYEQLEYAFTVWRAGSIPTLAIDHPALWGWQMHLLGDLLNGQRNQLMAREYFSEDTAKQLALRRDEAYLLAARYR